MLHDPPLLFLDEPTIGLDVVAKEHIRQFIKTVNRDRGAARRPIAPGCAWKGPTAEWAR